MLTVYHLPRTRSQRVVWLLEELGERYRIEKLTIPVSEDYLAINPLGSVPAIDDSGVRMADSIAIMEYLTETRAEGARLTVGPSEDRTAYSRHLQFLHFGEADLATPLSAVFRTRITTKDDAHSNPTLDELMRQLTKRLAFLDQQFGNGRTYVTGERFTIADISVGYALGRAQTMNLGDLMTGRLVNYLARLQARPAYKRAAEK